MIQTARSVLLLVKIVRAMQIAAPINVEEDPTEKPVRNRQPSVLVFSRMPNPAASASVKLVLTLTNKGESSTFRG